MTATITFIQVNGGLEAHLDCAFAGDADLVDRVKANESRLMPVVSDLSDAVFLAANGGPPSTPPINRLAGQTRPAAPPVTMVKWDSGRQGRV